MAWLLLCFLLPISGAWVPVPLGIAVALCLLVAIRRRPSIPVSILWPLFAYYGLHLLGMAWTENTAFGLFDVQVKLGLVLMPLAAVVVSTCFPNMLRRSMLAFTAGLIVSIALGLFKASNCFAENGLPNCFSQSTLSFQLHPSYAAWYACWAIAYWGQRILPGRVTTRSHLIATATLLPLLLVWVMMLASKSGVIGLALVLLYLLVLIVQHAAGYRRVALLGAAALLIAVSIWLQGPLIRDRMAAAVEAVIAVTDGDESIYTSEEGSDMRSVAWVCSIDRLKQDPFGAGTGDIKTSLLECYNEKGALEAAKRMLNCHNQFLQGGVALGWIGLLLALLVALVPLVIGLRTRHVALVLFMMLFLINALVESVLEVQAGVVFFGIFIGLLAGVRSSREQLPVNDP